MESYETRKIETQKLKHKIRRYKAIVHLASTYVIHRKVNVGGN